MIDILKPRTPAPKDTTLLFSSGIAGDTLARVHLARNRVDAMTLSEDLGHHTVPLAEEGLDMQLRTVLTALGCAMTTDEWNVAAEAFCMLQDAELLIRQRIYGHRKLNPRQGA